MKGLLSRPFTGALIAVAIFTALLAFSARSVDAATGSPVTGWAWSSTAGWISLNCSNFGTCPTSDYGLVLEEVEGSGGTKADLYGWAWSGTFGWICFGKTCPDDVANPEAVVPNYAQWRASYPEGQNISQMHGWARILSLGDRGWISLNCFNSSKPAACTSNYYLEYDLWTGNWYKLYDPPDTNPINKYNHFAWSGNDDGTGIGWIDFSLAHADWAPPSIGVVKRPPGIFEPQTIPASPAHPSQFTISLPHLTSPAEYLVECIYSKANGERKSVEKLLTSTLIDQPIVLTDYVPTIDNSESLGRIGRNRIWYLETCRLLSVSTRQSCVTDDDCVGDGVCKPDTAGAGNICYCSGDGDCGSNGVCKPDPVGTDNLCRKIADSSTKFPLFTHFNEWTLYGPEDDFYRAIKCYTGFTDQFFNNYQYCDLVGDATMSMAMSKGANVERNCVDGIDNDGNGAVDCNDSFCRNISTFCGLNYHKPIRCIWAEAGGALKRCTEDLYVRGEICCSDQPVAPGSDKNHIVNGLECEYGNVNDGYFDCDCAPDPVSGLYPDKPDCYAPGHLAGGLCCDMIISPVTGQHIGSRVIKVQDAVVHPTPPAGPSSVCGNGICQPPAEDKNNCPADCPPICGNGICEAPETRTTCPGDCPPVCPDGTCEAPETRASCPADCPISCGDSLCEAPETRASCPADCPPVCGDTLCEPPTETFVTCGADCPVPPDTTPPDPASSFSAAMIPNPANKISLTWTNPGDSDFGGVIIRRKTGGWPATPADGTLIYQGSLNAHVDNVPLQDTNYYYGVWAYDEVPNYSSGSFDMGRWDDTPPGDVQNFTAAPGDHSVWLTWDNPTDPDFAGVQIVRKEGSDPADRTDGTTVYDGAGTSHLDSGLTVGVDYHYAAFTYDLYGNYSHTAFTSAVANPHVVTCNDGVCEPPETRASCPADCPPYCGDSLCEAPPETYLSCPAECLPVCDNSLCETPIESNLSCSSDCPPVCGDAFCNPLAENRVNCPADCPISCGDSLCEAPETRSTCPADCPISCGDTLCEPPTETRLTCPADCPASCGDSLCEAPETRSTCPADCPPVCPDTICDFPAETRFSCPADCPISCGDTLCEPPTETRASCPADCPPVCGDTLCEPPTETRLTCPADCPASCGDSLCEAPETRSTCPADCPPVCGDGLCEVPSETSATCAADCPALPPGSYISSTPCSGNVCAGSFALGPYIVNYSYTQHLKQSGWFKIRFWITDPPVPPASADPKDYSVINTDKMMSFIIFAMPSFSSWDKYANPFNGGVYLGEENITIDRSGYERRDTDGCVGCTVDFVMATKYANLAPGEYSFNLYVLLGTDSGGINGTKFYVDPTAPSNADESEAFNAIGLTLPCADRIPYAITGSPVDNDLNYYPNCADLKCVGKQGHLLKPLVMCEIPEATCNDEFDNDADDDTDCADSDCDLKKGWPPLGSFGPAAYCQYGNEYGVVGSLLGTSPCLDAFDNDADGFTDCYDNQKWNPLTAYIRYFLLGEIDADPVGAALSCWRQETYGCPRNETNCHDGRDNDIDEPYSENEYQESPSMGSDCTDYDCGGSLDCPRQENRDKDGNLEECQCFDTVDNDLDRLIDCADPDCLGALCDTFPDRTCYDKEFDLAQRVNLCANVFDDDSDGPMDCSDSDCKGRFGWCGPCPASESFTASSCGDGGDDDADGDADCSDSDCLNKPGDTLNSAMCLAAENTDFACSDEYFTDDPAPQPQWQNVSGIIRTGFDNDGDGLINCADGDCSGLEGDPVKTANKCEVNENSCDDAFDNDGDGHIDCVDADCAGKSGCEAQDWTQATACMVVPNDSAVKWFTSVNPTVSAVSRDRVYVSSNDAVRLRGQINSLIYQGYSSAYFFVGDALTPGAGYPFAGPFCTLSGPSAGLFDMAVSNDAGGNPALVMISSNWPLGTYIASFDVTLTCPTPGAPATAKSYPVSLSSEKVMLDPTKKEAEFGDVNFKVSVFENDKPTVDEVEVEGLDQAMGRLNVPYGESREFRLIPRDPFQEIGPPQSSGICSCELRVGGSTYAAPDWNCLVAPGKAMAFTSDQLALAFKARATDGASNAHDWTSPSTSMPSVTVNVTPIVTENLELLDISGFRPSSGFIRGLPMPTYPPDIINTDVTFRTADNDSFGIPATCDYYLRNEVGTIIGGPGPTVSLSAGPGDSLGNIARCRHRLSTATSLNKIFDSLPLDDRYTLSVAMVDQAHPTVGDDDDAVISNRRTIYVCPSVPLDNTDPDNVCHWADFDHDGASEGFYTNLFSLDYKSCDNCVNLANDDQQDGNVDGIGDDCQKAWRCEVDIDLICSYHSWNYPDCGSMCCPPISGPETPQVRQQLNQACCPAPSYRIDPENPPDKKDPQACREAGICSITGKVCFLDEHNTDCIVTGTCQNDGAVGNACWKWTADVDCYVDGGPAATADDCVGEEECSQLMYPWFQTPFGNVFSGRNVGGKEKPPKENATFCIIVKSPQPTDYYFESELCKVPSSTGGTQEYTLYEKARLDRPKSGNLYRTSLGRIDIKGLLAGKYGEVVNITSQGQFDTEVLNGQPLGGKVYLVDATKWSDPTLVIDKVSGLDPIIMNSDLPATSAAGTVIVKGGNLRFKTDVKYETAMPAPMTRVSQIASVGWIALDQIDPLLPHFGTVGNIYIDRDVNELVGAFVAGGQSGIYSVTPPETESEEPLTVRGLMVARQFRLSRAHKSMEQGAERVIYDGRALVNPPPGFFDASRSLPFFGSIMPQ